MKYALVTGGSSGMGLEYVRQLAGRGYSVIIVALFQNETDAVKSEMEALHPDLDFLSIGMDLSQPDAARELYERVQNLEVEVLVNNAGILCAAHFKNMSTEEIRRVIMLHDYTTTLLCHYFLPSMLEQRKGYILNISSISAWFPYSIISTYAASKAFVRTFTKALRMECHRSGVKVGTIYFGAVDTNLMKLSPKLRKLLRFFGVMISAEKAARIALRMLFRGRSGRTPGFINRFFIAIRWLLPFRLLAWVDRTITRKWDLR